MTKQGTFCFSLDTELLWGRHDLPHQQFITRSQKERQVIKRLLQLLEKYNIAATWAIVGHLFLDRCSKTHSDIRRPHYSWVRGDWFTSDPGTDIKTNPEWYGTDIISEIRKYKNQEIASHSFSHLIFGDSGCTEEAAKTDINKCLELAQKQKIKLNSFVFPRNKIGYLDVLKEHGFTNYRGNPKSLKTIKPIQTIFDALDLFSPLSPPVSTPIKENGLINIPASLYFVSARGSRKYIPYGTRFSKAKRGIDKAIREGKVFHLWTHPIDLTDQTDILLKELEQILKYVADKRDQNLIESKTMEQIAKEVI